MFRDMRKPVAERNGGRTIIGRPIIAIASGMPIVLGVHHSYPSSTASKASASRRSMVRAHSRRTATIVAANQQRLSSVSHSAASRATFPCRFRRGVASVKSPKYRQGSAKPLQGRNGRFSDGHRPRSGRSSRPSRLAGGVGVGTAVRPVPAIRPVAHRLADHRAPGRNSAGFVRSCAASGSQRSGAGIKGKKGKSTPCGAPGRLWARSGPPAGRTGPVAPRSPAASGAEHGAAGHAVAVGALPSARQSHE